jgi:hypothetical protein
MDIRKLVLILFPVLLLGQPSNNTVTVTASRGGNPQPDQAVFSVMVDAGIDKGLDEIVGALAGSGITAGNLVQLTNQAVYNPIQPGPPQQQPALHWVFQLTVPFSKLKDTTASLTALQKTIAQKNNGLSLSFALQSTPVSPQSQTCDLAGLVNDARAQAQKIAGPAGASPGAIVGLSSAVAQSSPVCLLTVRFALGSMFGQPGPNAITITASRTSNPQADQVLIVLNVTSAVTAGLDDVTAALQGAGITGASFTGVNTQTIYVQMGIQSQAQPVLAWSFSLTTPIAKLSAVLGQVVGAQQTIAKQNAGLGLSFFVAGTQVSSQPACPQADLLADARAAAQRVAAAAGVTAGSILSLSEGGTVGAVGGVSLGLVPTAAFRAGDFTTVSGFGFATYPYASFLLSTPAANCALTVQFQLL